MTHAFYISAAYGVTAIVILCLIGWVWLDGRSRHRELKQLEASGIRRRSSQGNGSSAPGGRA
jgi:heme exporter protein D